MCKVREAWPARKASAKVSEAVDHARYNYIIADKGPPPRNRGPHSAACQLMISGLGSMKTLADFHVEQRSCHMCMLGMWIYILIH